MGGRGGTSVNEKRTPTANAENILKRFTYKSKLTNEQKQTLVKRIETDKSYLNKRGSKIIGEIEKNYSDEFHHDTGFITIGSRERARQALKALKKKGEKYGIFQDAKLIKTGNDWEIYHGW